MSLEYDPIINGKDPTTNIVGLGPINQWDDEGLQMRVYFRDTSGRVWHEDDDYYPFFFLSDIRFLEGFPKDLYMIKRLNGNGYYKYLVVFSSLRTYWQAVKYIRLKGNDPEEDPIQLKAYHSPVQQYLIQTGRTVFKGLAFADIYRMQVDIETYSNGNFPNAENEEDQIIIIAVSDNRGGEWLLHLECGTSVANGIPFSSEKKMLMYLVDLIQDKDPDVIEVHNGFAFDLPYIMTRCEMFGVEFRIGRDGSVPRAFERERKFADRSVEFFNLNVHGRAIIDTYFLAMDYDTVKRDMPSYSLKAVAKYFGYADEDRVYVDGPDIARTWDEDPARLLAYAIDDVRETSRIAKTLSSSTFYMAQIVPMDYASVDMAGSAAKIEAIFVREYLRQRESLPKKEIGKQQHGGYTDSFMTGVFGPVVYADVSSLYPSIMLNYSIQPERDTLKIFGYILDKLTTMRLTVKSELKNYGKTSDMYVEKDGAQSSYKIIINSFYGAIGSNYFIFNDFSEADRVATTGQDIIRLMISEIEKDGGMIVALDTDGTLFVPPASLDTEEKQIAYVQSLTSRMPPGIEIDHDGTFPKMVAYKKKNYVLQDSDGKLKYKGASIKSRAYEKFGVEFVKEAFRLLLFEDINGLHVLYNNTLSAIKNRTWTVEDFQTSTTLHDTLENYKQAVSRGPGNGGRNKDAAFELAIADRKKTGRKYVVGDKISHYISGDEKAYKVRAFEQAKFSTEWDPEHPDENTEYYIKKRFKEFCKKFKTFFEPADYDRIFSETDKLFPVDLSSIKIKNTNKNDDVSN
jgi:DNA polymerase, archaea type